MKSIDDAHREDAADLQYAYSGYLTVGQLSADTVRELGLVAERCSVVEIYPHAIELEYTGRDANRKILKVLLRLAELIRDADGEVRCQISGDADQLWFEFYRIRDGRLFRQRGEVVRQAEHEVTDPMS